MKKYIFLILRISGIPFLFRELIQKKRISILMFHDITVENAEKIFNYLKKKYNIIDLNDYLNARSDASFFKVIPERALIITFDDGHIRNYQLLPVLKKLQVPITIFLCSSIINTKRHYWFKYQMGLIHKNKLKKINNRERLIELSKLGFEQEKDFLEPQALQKEQIEEMKPYVNMQSHTMFHPILTMLSDEEAKMEIFGSKNNLEKDFGLNINAIAYPNGDYSERDIEFVKLAGYKCGVTVDFGYNTLKTDLFRLKRISVNDSNDLNEVIVKSSGAWGFFRYLYGIL